MRKHTTNNPDIEKNDHRWGFRDTQFEIRNGQAFFKNDRYAFMRNVHLPAFLPFIKETLDVDDLEKYKNQEIKDIPIPKPIINGAFSKAIKATFKAKNYSEEDQVRLIHSHGQMTTHEVYGLLYSGKINRLVDLVFFPYSEADVVAIVKLAEKHKVCLVPYGGGTSVTGALLVNKSEKRLVVSVDMRFMNQVVKIDDKNLSAEIEAGVVGEDLEEQLAKKGYTMGHEPDSSEFSTLGGWIATNASGMKKNRYGNIEDIVKSYRLITPTGMIENKNMFDRTAIGIDTKKIFFGNEGNFGIVTKAVVKIHHLPAVRKYASIMFPNFEQGVDFMQQLSKTNFISASVRLVDNTQFRFGYSLKEKKVNLLGNLIDRFKKLVLLKIKNFDPLKMCLMTLVFEGSKSEIEYQKKNNFKLAKKFGGISAGEANGKRGYMLTNLIAYIRDFLSDYFIIGETFETTVPWSKIHQVCKVAEDELKKHHKSKKIMGKPFISWRVTQMYHSDVCIYFTMGMYMKGIKNAHKVYGDIEAKIRERIMQEGGSISHHHGIGKIRDKFMKDIYNSNELSIIKSLKKKIDPKNTFGISNNILNK